MAVEKANQHKNNENMFVRFLYMKAMPFCAKIGGYRKVSVGGTSTLTLANFLKMWFDFYTDSVRDLFPCILTVIFELCYIFFLFANYLNFKEKSESLSKPDNKNEKAIKSYRNSKKKIREQFIKTQKRLTVFLILTVLLLMFSVNKIDKISFVNSNNENDSNRIDNVTVAELNDKLDIIIKILEFKIENSNITVLEMITKMKNIHFKLDETELNQNLMKNEWGFMFEDVEERLNIILKTNRASNGYHMAVEDKEFLEKIDEALLIAFPYVDENFLGEEIIDAGNAAITIAFHAFLNGSR
jgi:hypothetical protein